MEATRKLINAFALPVLSLLLALFLLPKITYAQPPSSPSASLAPANYQTYTITSQSPHGATRAFYDFSHAMSCIMIGQSPIAPCLEFKPYQDAQGMIRSVPVLSQTNTSNGLLGFSLSMIGEVIGTPPIRSSEFIANLGEQIGIKSAHAQVGGSGSGVLSSIFSLWEVSRNLAYFAMILIFVIVGLMVMFRQKLNPQTVVTIQMALPGLVIGLIMITFSYFLASLISDIAFLGTNVVGYYFSLADPSITRPTQLPLIDTRPNYPLAGTPLTGSTGTIEQEANVLTIFSRYTGIVSTGKLKNAVDSIWPYLNDPNRGEFPGLPIIGGVIGLWEGMDPQQAISILANMIAIQFLLPFGSLWGGKGQAITAIIPTLATLGGQTPFLVAWSLSWVAMLALIYSMFRLLLRLINSLLTIIFLTITAPFHFLAASLPGRQGIVSSWFSNMLCNVLAFPAVFAVFYFVAFLLKGQTSNGPERLFQVGQGVTIAPSTTFPLLGGIDLNFLNILIAFGALIALPTVPDTICKAVGKPSQLGAMLAGAVGGGIAQGQKYEGQLSGGAKGFAGNIGRLTDDPGHIMIVDENNPRKRYFRHPENTEEAYRAGARPGQWGKFMEGLRHNASSLPWRRGGSGHP